ncbi:hypothetical protein ACFU6S_29530 [Streptomyces sp. NPDC057456]|uniref:hypothetical protein n=1 Tax=Streptomyces sp. NPDC057456 TaxID=3346139 RepID=UPI003696CBDC
MGIRSRSVAFVACVLIVAGLGPAPSAQAAPLTTLDVIEATVVTAQDVVVHVSGTCPGVPPDTSVHVAVRMPRPGKIGISAFGIVPCRGGRYELRQINYHYEAMDQRPQPGEQLTYSAEVGEVFTDPELYEGTVTLG